MYNHVDDDTECYSVIIKGMLDCSFNFHEMSKKVFVPFEINKKTYTPLMEMDLRYAILPGNNYIKIQNVR